MANLSTHFDTYFKHISMACEEYLGFDVYYEIKKVSTNTIRVVCENFEYVITKNADDSFTLNCEDESETYFDLDEWYLAEIENIKDHVNDYKRIA